MAITTYSELQTAVKNWLHRADLDAIIPDFITLCEVKFNRRLRIATMETRVTATLDEQYESVPSDFLSMRSIQTTGASGRTLEYLPPDVFNKSYKTSNTGTPQYYTIIGSTIAIAPTPDSNTSYTMEMIYYKAISALSNSNTSNWMLSNHPDVYLYGSLAEAQGYLKDDKRIPIWIAQYEKAIAAVEAADDRERHPQSAMAIRPNSRVGRAIL